MSLKSFKSYLSSDSIEMDRVRSSLGLQLFGLLGDAGQVHQGETLNPDLRTNLLILTGMPAQIAEQLSARYSRMGREMHRRIGSQSGYEVFQFVSGFLAILSTVNTEAITKSMLRGGNDKNAELFNEYSDLIAELFTGHEDQVLTSAYSDKIQAEMEFLDAD